MMLTARATSQLHPITASKSTAPTQPSFYQICLVPLQSLVATTTCSVLPLLKTRQLKIPQTFLLLMPTRHRNFTDQSYPFQSTEWPLHLVKTHSTATFDRITTTHNHFRRVPTHHATISPTTANPGLLLPAATLAA